jgi:hypothetical protein
VVLTPRRWRQVCGERILQATETKSPVSGESTKETVKTNAQGMPVDCGVPVVTEARVYFFTHTRGYGCEPRTRHSLLPPVRGMLFDRPRARRAARTRAHTPSSRGAKRRSIVIPGRECNERGFDVQLHIRESITTIVSMDSPMRNCASVVRAFSAPRNDKLLDRRARARDDG